MGLIDDYVKIVAKNNGRFFDELSKSYKFKPTWQVSMTYDSPAESLEPVYFWIIDKMNIHYREKEKLVDNFMSSSGSGFHSEIGMKSTRMQEEAMKIFGTISTIVKSLLNLIYDLREFEIRLLSYRDYKSDDKIKKESALLSLKQIWIDQVDIKKGMGSINQMTYQLGFRTLRDAFMVAKDLEDVDKMDINDTVKRILKPRIKEFFDWVRVSEQELTKRFEIEKIYLRSQVDAIQMYSRWVKPYLKAIEQLSPKGFKDENVDIVNIFNTVVQNLLILGRKKIDVEDEIHTAALDERSVPSDFAKHEFKRNYYSCALIEFSFRGMPSRTQQGGFSMGGKVTVDFKSFSMNDDELLLFKERVKEDDIYKGMELAAGVTKESLDKLKVDIDHFLKEEKKETKKKEENKDDINPFSALIDVFKKEDKTENKEDKEKEEKAKLKEKIEKLKEKGVERDDYYEEYLRKIADRNSAISCYKLFDLYKKTHGMASMSMDPDWYTWEGGGIE